jgi:hypothetical protein
MQARTYPACLPSSSGPLPTLSSGGCSGQFPRCSVYRRAPAGRDGATSVRAVDGASAAAVITAAADASLPPPQVTWQIVVGAVGRSVLSIWVSSMDRQFLRSLCLTASAFRSAVLSAAGATPFVVAGVEFSKRIVRPNFLLVHLWALA